MVDTFLGIKIRADGGRRAAQEVAQIEDAVKSIKAENAKAAELAKLLAQEYGLTDKEAAQVAAEMKRVQAETAKAAREGGKLQKIFEGIAQGVGQELTSQGVRALQSGLAAVAGVATRAISEFESFEAALTEFDAKSDATAEQIARIGEQSKELAAVTSQTPAGVAALSTALLTLGATADDVEKNLGGITKLADVLGEDPVLTGRVVQTGISNFESLGESADTITDKLNTLINTTAAGSAQGIEEFFQFFQDVGPLAQTLDADFNQLAAGFATLRDSGFSAATGATGLRIALLRLSAPSGEAQTLLEGLASKIEGVDNLAFTADGQFRGFEETLRNFASATQDLNNQEQLELAKKIFGDEGAPAILALLSQVDGKYQQTLQNLGGAAGSVNESLEIVNQSLARQAELLEGNISGALTSFGEALAPIKLAVVELGQELLTVGSEEGVGLDRLAEAGQRLREALESNPEAVRAIGTALAEIASVLVGGVASAVNAFADAIANLDSSQITEQADQLRQLVANALDLAGKIGQVAAAFGQLSGNVGLAAVDAFNDLSPALDAAAGFLKAVLSAIEPLTQNTELLSAAMQVLAVRMVAIQGIALAKSLAATATALGSAAAAAGTAAGGVAAFTASIAAAAAPLAVLAAALAAVNFIKFTRELKVANDELDAYVSALDASTETGFKFANRLNNLNDAIAEAGGRATDEQLRKLEEYKRLSTAQVEDLQRQLQEVQAFEPQNDAQRQSQANLVNQLESTINALNNQIEEAEGTLSSTASAAGQETGENLAQGIAEGAEGSAEAVEAAAEEVVSAFQKTADANSAALSQIRQNELRTRAELLEGGSTQSELAKAEEQALAARVEQNRRYLDELKALQAGGSLNEDEAQQVADAIAQTEEELLQQRVDAAERAVAAQKAAEEERIKAAQEAAEKITDALEKERDEQKRIAEENFEASQQGQEQDFSDARRQDQQAFQDSERSKQQAFEDQQREAEAALQKQLQADQDAFRKSQETAAKDFQELQQNDAENFRKSQEAERKAFEESLQAERDRGSREFNALGDEVERRVALANASTREERQQLKAQFEEERKAAEERRKIEADVLRDRSSVLSEADQAGELDLSPLEQARADFERQLQDRQQAFQEAQQEAAQLFEEEQQAQKEAFEEERQAQALEFEAEQAAVKQAFEEQQREEKRAFEEEQRQAQAAFEEQQRQLERDFKAQQQQAEAEFKAQQRQLDEASAQRIQQILSQADQGIIVDGARKDGGPVASGKTYLVGEQGPELITPTRSGYVHTARETAALLGGVAVAAPTVNLPNSSAVEQKLDALLKAVQRSPAPVVGGGTFNFYGDQDQYGRVAEIQAAQLRSLVRRRGV